MAPPKDQPADKMKQKSLMSFFGKPKEGGGSATAPKAKTVEKKVSKSLLSENEPPSSDPPVCATRTPLSKSNSRSSAVTSAMFTRSSDGGFSAHETPPTSDPIDVDILSEEVGPLSTAKSATKRKRKIIADDSDEEDGHAGSIDAAAYKKKQTTRKQSPDPTQVKDSNGRAKKPRTVKAPPEDEDETPNDEEERVSSFVQRLTKYQKSPIKSKTNRRKSIDDDDFIVPDDTDEDENEEDHRSLSRASSRVSGSSSRLSIYAHSSAASDDEESEAPLARSKSMKKASARPALKQEPSAKGGNMFLTAAEQRNQQQKADKKASEDPFSFLLNVRDKDGIRPGELGYDPRTLYIPEKAWKDFTPFEKQFWEIKQNHFDTILFFQKGKFLELYEEDARIGHREFDLKMTQRVKMSMVGVPEMSFNFWAAKFLAKGYKVGRVDQAETALGAEMRLAADKKGGKAKKTTLEDKGKDKIVRRQLNKVYTNGTLVDAELLTDEQAGHCVSIREEETIEGKTDKQAFGICVLDSATSEFNLSAFEDDVCRTRLETMFRQLRPKEIIFTKGNLSVSTTRLLKAILPGNCLWTSLRESEGLSYAKTIKELKKLYSASEDDSEDDDAVHGLSNAVPEAIREMLCCKSAVEALGSMIWYLNTLNIDKDILSMKNFNVYDPMKRGQGLVLDGQTLAHIEILQNSEGTEEGSLLQLLSRCITPSGKRLFRIWLCMPLREASDIIARLDAVQDLMDHPTFEQEFTKVAKGLPDLERIVSRIHANNCKVKDFLRVLASFKNLSTGLANLADTAESFQSKTILGLLRSAPDLTPNIKHVKSMFKRPEEGSDEVVPEDGQDEIYDGIMNEINELEEELEKELKKLSKKMSCDLSYWHSVQGTKDIYLVQTSTKLRPKNIPVNWSKSSSTKAADRWIVPELQLTIRKLKEARENRDTAIKQFKGRLYAEFDADRSVWLRAIRVLSEFDCLFSLAKASSALGQPVCRPEFVEGDAAWIDFEELRHPALCVSTGLKGDFIPNDVKLGGDVGRIALLTGPNMGGKSTAMRMTATGVIMAQLGMLVPAKKARLCPVDSILTRMGAYDNMFSNASTFKVELDECCKILRDATPKSLVILDELGRGTSTYDGMAIAGAVLHQFATHTLALSFFATHYGSLTDDFAYHPNIRNMHMETMVDDEKCELIFLYKLVDGVASSSFGTHVASLAGVPSEVVQRADVVSQDFARNFKEKIEGKKSRVSGRLPLVAQADFAYLHGLATGKYYMPQNKVRQREVLQILKNAARNYLLVDAA